MAEFNASVNFPFKTSDGISLRLHFSYIISHIPLSRQLSCVDPPSSPHYNSIKRSH